MRTATFTRTTKETDIRLTVCLDGSGKTELEINICRGASECRG